MGWIGRRLAIVAALTLLAAQLSGISGQLSIGRTEPSEPLSLVNVQRFGTVTGAERTLSKVEFQSSPKQGLVAQGNELLPRSGSAGVLTTDPVASPILFSHVGVRWRGSLVDFHSVAIELRASRDGATWTDWREVEVDDDLQFGADGQLLSRLADLDVHDGMYRYAQARLTLTGDGSAVPSISSLSFAFIDPYGGPSEFEAARVAAAMGSVNPQGVAKPTVISRTAWGSPDGQISPSWTPEYKKVTNIIVHHTATRNNATDWAVEVRAIWYYHAVTNRWGDIGYNFLVDPNGKIYEGRAGGDDVVAGHALQYNWGSLGVAFLGDHTSSPPSTAASSSLISLLSWKADQRAIDPTVLSRYFVDKNLPNIMGHRDALYTTCPGSSAYSLMPTIRASVRDNVAAAPPPSSQVAPLPRYQNRQPFEVTWSGTDTAASYYVQYRDGPNGAWVDWPGQSPTTATKALFSGGNGHTYYFRSLAANASGSKEAKSADKFDAFTTVDTTGPTISVSVPSSTTRNWFVVNWSASDSISGMVANYDVDVSNDQVNWRAWVRGATGNGALFVDATPGSKYYFKVTGRDNAGNFGTTTGGPITAGADSSGLSRVRLPSVARNAGSQ